MSSLVECCMLAFKLRGRLFGGGYVMRGKAFVSLSFNKAGTTIGADFCIFLCTGCFNST